ncbi:MAG: Colicin production protein [Betaproteobacteria bacterium]|nr:Colicin production protein [Betaproteobacteria bacterium]
MTWVDYAVIAIVGLSILLSVIHGLVREIMSLASWVMAFLVAQLYAGEVAALLPAALTNGSLRLLAGFLAVFLAVLIIMTLVAMAISGLLKTAGLGFADRALGAVFGFMRGLAIVMIAVLLSGLTALPRQAAWRNAIFTEPLVILANWTKVWLPDDMAKHINYG